MKPSDTNDESNDPVWELLKSARKTGASPVFVQNTVRHARQLSADGDGSAPVPVWSGILQLLRRPAVALPLAAAAAVVIGLVVNYSPSQVPVEGNVAKAETTIGQTDTSASLVESPATATTNEFSFSDQIDEIDYLGDLVVVTDPASLNEQMLADLLY